MKMGKRSLIFWKFIHRGNKKYYQVRNSTTLTNSLRIHLLSILFSHRSTLTHFRLPIPLMKQHMNESGTL